MMRPATPERFAPTAMLVMLAAQFLTGMYVNLYVQLPTGTGTAAMAAALGSGLLFLVHGLLGVMLVVGAPMMLMMGAVGGARMAVWPAIGLVGVLLAGLGGVLFVVAGHADAFSLVMAIGFLVAAAGYVGQLANARV
jgi:hypothetical protein